MSDAVRTRNALDAAHENIKSAGHAIARHSHRGDRGSLAQHVADMRDLVESMATMHRISADLAAIAKSCADNVRFRYFHGFAPSGGTWPEPLKAAAADADRALSKLRSHLSRTPAGIGHDSLAILHGFLRDMQRDQNRNNKST